MIPSRGSIFSWVEVVPGCRWLNASGRAFRGVITAGNGPEHDRATATGPSVAVHPPADRCSPTASHGNSPRVRYQRAHGFSTIVITRHASDLIIYTSATRSRTPPIAQPEAATGVRIVAASTTGERNSLLIKRSPSAFFTPRGRSHRYDSLKHSVWTRRTSQPLCVGVAGSPRAIP